MWRIIITLRNGRKYFVETNTRKNAGDIIRKEFYQNRKVIHIELQPTETCPIYDNFYDGGDDFVEFKSLAKVKRGLNPKQLQQLKSMPFQKWYREDEIPFKLRLSLTKRGLLERVFRYGNKNTKPGRSMFCPGKDMYYTRSVSDNGLKCLEVYLEGNKE